MRAGEHLISHLIEQIPVHKERVVRLGQLTSQEGEEAAHLGRSEVWVVHHHLSDTEYIELMNISQFYKLHFICHIWQRK